MVVGRLAVLLLGEKKGERLLLGGCGCGQKGDRAHLHAGLDRSLIELGLCQAMNLPIQRNSGGGESAGNAILRGSLPQAARNRGK